MTCHGTALVMSSVLWSGVYNQYLQVVALHAEPEVSLGSLEVFGADNYVPTSISADAECSSVFVGVGPDILHGDDIGGQFLVFDFRDGTLLWNQTSLLNVGSFMATKTVRSGERSIVLLLTNPQVEIYDSTQTRSRLYAYAVDKPRSPVWYVDTDFSLLAEFAVSKHGVVFGNTGLRSGREVIGIEVDTGKTIFQVDEACTNSSLLSGPAVDHRGYAYYRLVLWSYTCRLQLRVHR